MLIADPPGASFAMSVEAEPTSSVTHELISIRSFGFRVNVKTVVLVPSANVLLPLPIILNGPNELRLIGRSPPHRRLSVLDL